jgi:hypothetical protein
MHIQDRRRAKRFPLDLSGCMVVNGSTVGLKIRDISLSGALVEFAVPQLLEQDAELHVRLYLGFSGVARVCRAGARDGRILYGIKFDRFDYYSDHLLDAYLSQHERRLSGTRTLQ